MVHVRVARGLFRCHVRRRADGHPDTRHRRLTPRIRERLGDPEIHHQCVPVREQDVVGLHVAVHDAASVGVRERVGHIAQDRQGLREGQGTGPCHTVPQRLALDVRHDVVGESVALTRVQQRQDVRMLQLRGDLDLAEEPARAQGGRQFRPQHLDGHLAAVLHVLGEPDDGHAARAKLPLQAIAVAQNGLESIGERGGGLAHRQS